MCSKLSDEAIATMIRSKVGAVVKQHGTDAQKQLARDQHLP